MLDKNETICIEKLEPTEEWLLSQIAIMLHERANKDFLESLYFILKENFQPEFNNGNFDYEY
jgi:hypothetical protein